MTAPQRFELGDRTLPRVGLGTNRLIDTEDNRAFLRAAVDAGVRFIDTAHLYTSGESERALGAALAPFADDLVVATKGGYKPGEGRPEVLRQQLEESFRRLETDTISLYYLHRVDPETPLEESLGVLAEYAQRGLIEHVGVSAVTAEELERARQVVPIAAVQNEYNLSERGSDPVIDLCGREGILFVPYYPLRAVPAAAREIAGRYDATPEQIVIAWLLKRSPVVVPIPGTLSIDHLRQNLGALEIDLSDDDFARLGG